MDFGRLAGHLSVLTESAHNLFSTMTASERGEPYAGSSSWTRGELLGHLIDSAINNQQRFVRALIEEELRFPSYAQSEMIRMQRCSEAPEWNDAGQSWSSTCQPKSKLGVALQDFDNCRRLFRLPSEGPYL